MDFSQLFEFSFPFLERFATLRAILGFILVFFKRINVIERIALSVGLSIAAVTLSNLILHILFGVRITGTNSLLIIIVIAVIVLAVYFIKRLRNK